MLFFVVSRLYKRLPSKVKLLDLVLNVYFIGFQLYSEGKLYSSTSLFSNYCISYRSHPLADGTYELIHEPDGDISEAQANVAELTEVPNPNSEEQKPTDFIDITEGKSRCIIPLF